jgi:methionyl-tRNA formyltransferase
LVKVLFFGTPQVAVPFLDWLTSHASVTAVVCQPDQPVGRGYEITAPPTKVFAMGKKIPVLQPAGPWTDDIVAQFQKIGSDIGIAVAYGRILPEKIFLAPRLGSINIHFSLLPKYRGAAPIQWSLINGETKTGVTAFWLEKGLDSGPIFHQEEMAIDPDDNAASLRKKLTALGVEVLAGVMKDVEAGRLVKEPQKGEGGLAPSLKKEDGRINWNKPAIAIVNLIRGVCEWPGAQTAIGDRRLKVIRASADAIRCAEARPGEILEAKKEQGIFVQAGEGRVCLAEIQPEGKKPMPAWAFWQGARMKVGDRFL